MEDVLFTPEELQSELTDNFDGNNDNDIYGFDGDIYDGQDDPSLNFVGTDDGKGSFSKMAQNSRTFGFDVDNKTDSAKVIAISTGSLDTRSLALVYDDAGTLKYKVPVGKGVVLAPVGSAANDILSFENAVSELLAAGIIVDAVLDDGIIYAEAADPTKYIKVTPTIPRSTVRHLREYIKETPTLIVGMHITCTDATMFQTDIVSKLVNPYGVYGEKRISFEKYYQTSQFLQNKIVVKAELQLDPETIALITIPAGAKVTFSMQAGVVESTAHALTQKRGFAESRNMCTAWNKAKKKSLKR